MEDNSRYLCAETAEDRKRFVAAVVKNKVSDISALSLYITIIILSCLPQYPNGGIQTPIMPVRTVPLDIDPRNRGVSVLVCHMPPFMIEVLFSFHSIAPFISY